MNTMRLLPALLVLGACGGGTNRQDPESAPINRPAHYEPGSLVEVLVAIHDSKWKEECDTATESLQFEVAAAIDKHKDEISAFAKARASDPALFDKVDVGPIYLQKRKSLPEKPTGWQEDADANWKELHARYLKLKGQPMNLDWYLLSREVRSRILDDESRVVYSENYGLTKDDGPKVLELESALDACLKDTACGNAKLSESLKTFVANNSLYDATVGSLQRMDSGADAYRERLAKVRKWVGYDANRYRHTLRSNVKRLSDTELALVLDPGSFSGATEVIESLLITPWTSDKRSVRIEWSEAPRAKEDGLSAFRLLADPTAGSRSFVSYQTQSMTLYSGSQTTTPGHELGHVLGFPDRYFTIWEPRRCAYKVQWNPDDLMSDHTWSPKATAADLETLAAAYPTP